MSTNEALITRLLIVLAVITAIGFVLATVYEGVAVGLAWVVATYLGAFAGVGLVGLIRRWTA